MWSGGLGRKTCPREIDCILHTCIYHRQPTRFKPVRAKPSRFQVCLLNHFDIVGAHSTTESHGGKLPRPRNVSHECGWLTAFIITTCRICQGFGGVSSFFVFYSMIRWPWLGSQCDVCHSDVAVRSSSVVLLRDIGPHPQGPLTVVVLVLGLLNLNRKWLALHVLLYFVVLWAIWVQVMFLLLLTRVLLVVLCRVWYWQLDLDLELELVHRVDDNVTSPVSSVG